MEADLQPLVSQDDSNNDESRCFLCKRFCNKKKRTGRSVTAITQGKYGIPESDLQPDALICLKCHFKQVKIKAGRISIAEETSVDQIVKGENVEVNKGTSSEETVSGVTKTGKTVVKNSEHSEAVYGAVNSNEAVFTGVKSKESVCDKTKSSELAHNEVKNSELAHNEVKKSEPITNKTKCNEPVPNMMKGSEPVHNEIKSSEPVLNVMESSTPIPNEAKSGEAVSDGKCGKQSECSAMMCAGSKKGSNFLFVIPGRFFTLPPDTKQMVKSQFGKQKGTTATKTYACGWCKFRSVHSSDVVKHHYKTHQRRELDIVRLKSHSPKLKSPSGIGFNCDSCNYTGRLRHQLHLHNDRYHKNALNRDGTTDYESDNSLVNPSYLKNMMLPSNYFQMQQQYKIKDAKISCEDILKSGLGYLIDRVIDEGISKLCVDNLTEYEFVSMATMYHEDVSYCDTRVENYVPVDMGKLEIQEIESIVRN